MEKIRILFIEDQLVCGGAEQALFDLMCMLDPEKFETAVLEQKPGGTWNKKFRNAGLKIFYDYCGRKETRNPIVKLQNLSQKMRTQKAYAANGEGLLDVIFPGWADIVVSYSMWDYPLCGFASGAKSVKFIHCNMETDRAFHDLILRDRELIERYDRIVCVSEIAGDAFIRATGRSKGVEVHRNPINSEQIHRMAQEKVVLPEDAPVVCAVGRLSYEKGFERLIVIHKRLLEAGVFHRLVIVGDGPDRDYILRTIRAMDAEDTVILAGYQLNPYPYILRSKMLICPSYTEGLSMTAMEALCLGVPVVAAVPSVKELFGDEICGLITDNDNASLSAGIRRMLTDDAFYQQTVQGARNRSAYFDGKRMVKEIEDMFLSLVERN